MAAPNRGDYDSAKDYWLDWHRWNSGQSNNSGQPSAGTPKSGGASTPSTGGGSHGGPNTTGDPWVAPGDHKHARTPEAAGARVDQIAANTGVALTPEQRQHYIDQAMQWGHFGGMRQDLNHSWSGQPLGNTGGAGGGPAAGVPVGTALPATEIARPRDYRAEALALFPWMPQELLDAYVSRWAETDNSDLALAAMRGHQNYDLYFAGNRTKDGRFRFDEAGYLAYKDAAINLMRDNGLPAGFYDDINDIGALVSGEVSINELANRISRGYVAAMSAPKEMRDELERLYGVGPGKLAAFFIDPDRAFELIQRDFAAAQLSGTAKIAGFGQLSRLEAERLNQAGVSADRAGQAFGALAQSRELFTGLIGTGEDDISREDQLAAAFENSAFANERIQRRREARLAAFQGGGGAFASNQGIVGLGRAS